MSELKPQMDKIPLNRVTHSVRSAQAILQYGVGAMVDFPDQTLMTAAPEYWSDKVIKIHDERLEKVLGVSYFGTPGGSDQPGFREGISYVRFPQWYFCPKCRRFQPIKEWYKEYKSSVSGKIRQHDPYMKNLRCPECRQELVAARVVTVCPKGHIDDFPWIKWVHARTYGGPKKVCDSPQLTFVTGSTATAGLEGLIVKCKNCGARASLYQAFDPNIFQILDGKGKDKENIGKDDFLCTGNKPWKHHSELCGEYPRAMQRGASSIYFPQTVSSLVIPPYSDKLNIDIENCTAYQDCLTKISVFDEDERDERIAKWLDRWSVDIAMQISRSEDAIKPILERKLLGAKEVDEEYHTDSIKYRAEEFDALTGIVAKVSLDLDDFVRESMDVEKYSIPGIKGISLIHKIREVRALTGFTRINPPGSSNLGKDTDGLISVKEPETPWYPAYEVRGEGIFLEFDSRVIDTWVNDSKMAVARAKIINDNYSMTRMSEYNPRNISAQFIFLHTLAHLLIRQMSFECGYAVASLRERIYYSSAENGKEMAGILIYTASGDSEGTLGGLVRQGRPDALPKVFRKAVESSMICSNDPVCISTEQGQGRDALNLAACHACTLLPETSCEEFNVFLDRALITGTFDNCDIGFYGNWVNN